MSSGGGLNLGANELGFRIEARAEGGHRVIEEIDGGTRSWLATAEEAAMWALLVELKREHEEGDRLTARLKEAIEFGKDRAESYLLFEDKYIKERAGREQAEQAVGAALHHAKRAWFSGRISDDGEPLGDYPVDEFNAETERIRQLLGRGNQG